MNFSKENFIHIGEEIIKKLVDEKQITLLASRKNERYEALDEKTNKYYKINDLDNTVFLHVQDGYGVIINETIESVNGSNIDIVDILSEYYWYIHNANDVARCASLEVRDLARCIGSIIAYENIEQKLPTWCEVHHVGYRWDNTQSDLRLWCQKKHKKYHDGVGTRKSHRRGIVIRDVEHFAELVTYMK